MSAPRSRTLAIIIAAPREVADAAEGTAIRSVIDVDILGHIFEQSITDLERLRLSVSSADFQSAVSPTSSRQGVDDRTACGLETRDTAGWKPALPAEPGKVGRRRKQESASSASGSRPPPAASS